MLGVEYGNSKVEVTYSQSRNRSSSSCGSSCSGYSTARFYLAPDYFQRQYNCKYLRKKLFSLYTV